MSFSFFPPRIRFEHIQPQSAFPRTPLLYLRRYCYPRVDLFCSHLTAASDYRKSLSPALRLRHQRFVAIVVGAPPCRNASVALRRPRCTNGHLAESSLYSQDFSRHNSVCRVTARRCSLISCGFLPPTVFAVMLATLSLLRICNTGRG